MQKGTILKTEIIEIAQGGDGVAKPDNFTLFIPETVPGDTVLAEVTEAKKTYGRAKVLEVLQAGPERVMPACSYFASCGGCSLQQLSYMEQLKAKRKIVQDSLTRIGGFKDIDHLVKPVLGMTNPWYYRNKIAVPVQPDSKRQLRTGFYEKGTHNIVEMDKCLLQADPGNEIWQTVVFLAREYGLQPYDEKTHQGVLRHILIRVARRTNEALVVLVLNTQGFPQEKELAKEIMKRHPQVVGVVKNTNTKKTNAILGSHTETILGKDHMIDYVGPLAFKVSARSFFQVNPQQAEVLYQVAKEYAGLTGKEHVLDLYSGIGTIALYLAPAAKKVTGIEVVPEAIEDAKKNAEFNNLNSAIFVHGDVAELLTQKKYQADVIVVDPPRKGLDLTVIEGMVKMGPQRIIYVSCNPATMARDLKEITNHGYTIRAVQPVDMFPQTPHVECVVLMSRVEK